MFQVVRRRDGRVRRGEEHRQGRPRSRSGQFSTRPSGRSCTSPVRPGTLPCCVTATSSPKYRYVPSRLRWRRRRKRSFSNRGPSSTTTLRRSLTRRRSTLALPVGTSKREAARSGPSTSRSTCPVARASCIGSSRERLSRCNSGGTLAPRLRSLLLMVPAAHASFDSYRQGDGRGHAECAGPRGLEAVRQARR